MARSDRGMAVRGRNLSHLYSRSDDLKSTTIATAYRIPFREGAVNDCFEPSFSVRGGGSILQEDIMDKDRVAGSAKEIKAQSSRRSARRSAAPSWRQRARPTKQRQGPKRHRRSEGHCQGDAEREIGDGGARRSLRTCSLHRSGKPG